MTRNEVKQSEKWDLSAIYADAAAWQNDYDKLKNAIGSLDSFKGQLADKAKLLDLLKKNDALNETLEDLYVYAHMFRDENSALDIAQDMAGKIDMLLGDVMSDISWITPQLTALPLEFLQEVKSDATFVDYTYFFEDLIRSKEHILSEKEERLLSLSQDVTGSFKEIFGMFNNIEANFAPVTIDGEKVPLTHGSYSMMLGHPDVNVRKEAFENLYTVFKSHVNTIAATYSGNVKKGVFYARARGYAGALDAALEGDNIPKQVYTNLVDAVGKATPLVHEYVKLRNKVLGGEIHMYDMYVPIVEGADLKLSYDEAYELVQKALEPLGAEYAELLKTAKTGGWIDVHETENKRSGAYSWGNYSAHPYVLLNYQQDTHDVFTVAHEMGHAIHSYYSNKTQPFAKAQYNIFVAEVASTVNEALLLKYLIKNTKDVNQKKYLLSYYLDMFRTTLFRQTMFAEFEMKAHEMAQAGVPLTQKTLSDMYYELNQKYYGEGVIHDDMIRYEWARIPHFYNAFYVYKYSTGLTSAISIAQAILSEGEPAVARYKKFLCAGGSIAPHDVLKISGIDLTTTAAFDAAMAEFAAALEELKTLV